jgi:glycosyltransferase involved in cell wall biosynthesis
MNKKLLLFRAPVKSVSGYGSHSRDLLFSLYKMNLFEIKIDSCLWGHTPLTALDEDTEFNRWVLDNIVKELSIKPDIYIQVTVPNEFRAVGKYNIGITAGIETTAIPKDWIDGCNRMDLIITTSNFSKEIIEKTFYNEIDNATKQITNTHKVIKPVEVLFEGIKTDIYNNNKSNFELNIKEDFSFLFVGHWLRGVLGQDRKDVGMLIKTFAQTFSDDSIKPALVLKTSSATFSIKDREMIKNKIRSIVSEYKNPPSIYLLFGELSETEMNGLYNNEKIKTMVTFTKGEGFGRPLLEFTMTGKPVIASDWSGHKDFLSKDKSILLNGSINNVHDSVVDNFIIKESKWFTVNYDEASRKLRDIFSNYKEYVSKSNDLMIENKDKFSINKMTERFQELLRTAVETPVFTKINLPKLTKVS